MPQLVLQSLLKVASCLSLKFDADLQPLFQFLIENEFFLETCLVHVFNLEFCHFTIYYRTVSFFTWSRMHILHKQWI